MKKAPPWRWLPFIAFVSFVFYMSSRPGATFPPAPFWGWDKVAHFIAFFTIVSSLAYALGSFTLMRAPVMSFVLIAFFGFAFGILDEWHQSFVPGREVSGYDLIADVAGSVAASLGVRYFLLKRIHQLRQIQ